MSTTDDLLTRPSVKKSPTAVAERTDPLEDMGPPPERRKVLKNAEGTYAPRWRRTKQIGLTGKLTAEMIARIELRLTLPGGATLMELGGDLQLHMGSDQSPDSADSKAMKLLREEQRRKEIGQYVAQVNKYLTATYGEDITDDHGRVVAVGSQIEIEKGHYRRLY